MKTASISQLINSWECCCNSHFYLQWSHLKFYLSNDFIFVNMYPYFGYVVEEEILHQIRVSCHIRVERVDTVEIMYHLLVKSQ